MYLGHKCLALLYRLRPLPRSQSGCGLLAAGSPAMDVWLCLLSRVCREPEVPPGFWGPNLLPYCCPIHVRATSVGVRKKTVTYTPSLYVSVPPSAWNLCRTSNRTKQMTQISPAQLSLRAVLLAKRIHTSMSKSRNGNRRQDLERKYIGSQATIYRTL